MRGLFAKTSILVWIAIALWPLAALAQQEEPGLMVEGPEPTPESTPAPQAEAGPTTIQATLLSEEEEDDDKDQEALACTSPLLPFDELSHNFHERVYRVGVRDTPGQNEAVYTALFSEYLTKTAGRRFDPPIEFEMIELTFDELMQAAENKEIDFVFANPSIFSCVGTELGATALATVISKVTVRGHVYELDMYGGVMFTLSDRDDITVIKDFKDKIIGRGALGDLAGGQMQFYEMVQNGVSYTLEPKQIIVTKGHDEVVQGVLDGTMDIGFVQTNKLERTTDEDGKLLDPALFKIIEPEVHILDTGEMFPFLHSTDIYPEWPVAALESVHEDVALEVQNALLALSSHAAVAQRLEVCAQTGNMTAAQCDSLPFPGGFSDKARCDTTKDIAITALNATRMSFKEGFRTPRSYFDIRTMQQAAGILNLDHKGHWKCRRTANFYENIGCPAGYKMVTEEEFKDGCAKRGLQCKEGWDCFCQPCEPEVSVYLIDEESKAEKKQCALNEICATAEQRETITIRAEDNVGRSEVRVRAVFTSDLATLELPIVRENGTYYHDFQITFADLGMGTVDVYVNDAKIVLSPFQVQIVPKDCEAEFPGDSRAPSDDGSCVCNPGTMDMGGKCYKSEIVFSLIASFVILVALVIAYFYVGYKRRMSDQMWLINAEELHFGEPAEVIGQGSFGVVLLAEYRGTKVAIKSAIPVKTKNRGGSRGGGSGSAGRVSRDGSTDLYNKESTASSEPMINNSGSDKKESEETVDLETGLSAQSFGGTGGTGDTVNLEVLAGMSFGRKQNKWARLLFGKSRSDDTRLKSDILGSSTGGSSMSKSIVAHLLPCFDKQRQQKEAFMLEMRLLSRLRHPCITTVMGAVISTFHDPMLVMEYMEYGSLYDLLQNETMYAGGDIILQIMRDIAQGLRYLHSSKPPIYHGDLKAKNILIDSRFRAKVADFGLSTKKKNCLTGTPYFMAPEYLRGKSDYTTACDIYSVGMIMFEIYAREDPYKGEHLMRVLCEICDPRKNRRPNVPASMPPKMVDLMKKCWGADPFFRPQAKDLDMQLMDMGMQDAEPFTPEMISNSGKAPKLTTVDMMYEVFPRHIADALKAGRKVESEQHELVTVFFSDIVGYTDISRQMSPVKVCDLLERLYEEFDRLSRAHKVFKVETIGDSYMGVTNLDGAQEDEHVKNIAEFALAAIDAANKVMIDKDQPSKGCVKIRAGFHSGSVVSNVIGSLNPRYGLFGDTVNTASRMESNSTKGRILCSEKSAKLLMKQAPHLSIKKRGKLAVKGKGEMITYWVGKPVDAIPEQAPGDQAVVLEDESSVSRHVDFEDGV